MLEHVDHLKESLVEKVVNLTHERLDPATQGMAERLVRASYANVAPQDIVGREPATLYGAVMALLALARQRPLGQAKLRVHQPRPDEGGWSSEHSVVESINDDMPFLVDSLTGALQNSELSVHLVLHPILSVLRDDSGKLLDILTTPQDGARLESFLHIEIDRLPAGPAAQSLAERLTGVLADVRCVAEDSPSIRQRMKTTRSDLAEPPPGLDTAEVTEVGAFLDWLDDHNFTFLGSRVFCFEEKGKAQTNGAVHIESGSGLGLLRDDSVRIFDTERDLSAMSSEVKAFLRQPHLLLLAKADRVSTVHRAAQMDIVGVKRFNAAGKVVALHVIVGLFTHSAYTQSPLTIPVLRRKVRRVIERAGFRPDSYDGKALQAILENYPRDELLQANEDALFDTALGILQLQERQRVAVFLRHDEFERFVSLLVFIPRDRYDTRLRLQAQQVVEEVFAGKVSAWYTQVSAHPLARLQFIVETPAGSAARIDRNGLESRLAELARSWVDRLREVLVEQNGEDRGLALYRRWGRCFPVSYQEDASPRTACSDIERIEASGEDVGLYLYRPLEAAEAELHFKIYRRGQPVALSDVLPLFEHLGLRVISELPHELRQSEEAPLWIHDFTMTTLDGRDIDIETLRDGFENAFRAIWKGDAEDDGFNRLVLDASLTWRQVMVLRAYSKYLRQTGSAFSQAYVERSLAANPAIAVLLLRLFETRFNPATASEATDVSADLAQALEAVSSADEDRVLRQLVNLVDSTLRTNYFQTTAEGEEKSYLALKLDSRRVQGLPLPRPLVEIFVYSPRTEAIHLRAGQVSRGGIRWSDRPEDFRTETLGLMKAQTAKNSVIVPVGAKGGFVVKHPPKVGGREALLEEGIACYKTLMRGLLDLTDNISGGRIVPPPRVVRRDGDDPYLVVAADKGTASFSDIANAVSAEYGFWLGDAFASGGSRGYDHKALAITARGAWESVKRHFREMGLDTQGEDFTVVGVGDMSGDVFGNGMLRSQHIKLIAAFDHRHIFLDPDPDPASSFVERQRLSTLQRSSWADYDPRKLSAGGGIFARDAKSIPLSQPVRERLGLIAETLSPSELIRALLTAPIDLLWFGGIGTYVKASDESNADVGDRANDALRVDGAALRCKVVAEGGNLAVTQRGRVESALAGIRLNTDAIDNSAGVDCSDHEVNIKILLDAAVAEGDLTVKQRNNLLIRMTDEVGSLVLRDNYLQTQAISIFAAHAPRMLDQQERFMRLLEHSNRLNRKVEFLPTDEEFLQRTHAGRGLTRPEIAILMAYSKDWLYDAILHSDLPDDPVLIEDLVRYFPSALRTAEWRRRMEEHRLRREIVATSATNSIINRVGGSFVARMMERTGASPADLARAYLIVRDSFALRDVWSRIEDLDGKISADVQTAMYIETNRLIERGISWILSHSSRPLDVGRLRAELEPGIAALRTLFSQVVTTEIAAPLDNQTEAYVKSGVPEDLARQVASLVVQASANDISRIAGRTGQTIDLVAHLYFMVSGRFGLNVLRSSAESLAAASRWHRQANDALIEDLYNRQAALTESIAIAAGERTAEDALSAWMETKRRTVEQTDQLLVELKVAEKLDLAMLTVASHQLRALMDEPA